MKKEKSALGKVAAGAFVLLMASVMLGGLPGTAVAASKFNIGDTVEVTDNLNVRICAGTDNNVCPEITDPDYPGCAPKGTLGKILSGPSSGDGYIWWKVDFGPGLYSGWSVEKYLETPCPHSCWDRSALSGNELATLVRNHFPLGGVTQTGESIRVTAYAVAMAESDEGNPSACGDPPNQDYHHSNSIGLWQIYTPVHVPPYDKCRLFEEDYNANAAKEISNNGGNWNPWCTWEKTACDGNGDESYKKYSLEARGHFYPKVTSLSVSSTSISLGESVRIYYSVSDDVGLDRVELWRTTDKNGDPDPSIWEEIKRASISGTSYSYYFTDTHTSPGIYWYGIHVADNSGAPEAWNDEKNSRTGSSPGVFGPIKVEVTSNQVPTLSSGYVTPSSGDTSTTFDYYVTYTDSDGDAPTTKYVYVDSSSHTMTKVSGDYTSGATFRYSTTLSAVGTHSYYFYFNDGQDHTKRLPASGAYLGPSVSSPNYPPLEPRNPSPSKGATNVGITANLIWSGGDPDVYRGDSVTYDVYFEKGDSSPDVLVSDDQTRTTYDPSTLDYGSHYYWKIVAKDKHGATTEGEVWDFTTVPAPTPVSTHNIDTGEHFQTIQAAIDDFDTENGHTIIVDAGTHYESIVISKSITLQGVSKDNTIIDGGGSGNAIYVIADNVDISGFTIQNGNWGIQLVSSSGNTIIGNIISADNCVKLFSSSGNTISENTITSRWPLGWESIYLDWYSQNNRIIDNTISNSMYGLFIADYCDNNLIINNIMSNNFRGIYLGRSSGNTMSGNTITSSDEWGIRLWESSGNTIYHNNFIDNAPQVVSDTSTNTWDKGYPSGGNYWSDYSGSDLFSGPNQNMPGSDGIGDNPYNIPSSTGDKDNYPFIKENGGLIEQSYVISSNALGTEKNVFDLSENVYCYAGNLPANTKVKIYVADNKDDWKIGDSLTDVSGGAVPVTTNSSGGIWPSVNIWSSPLTVGKYDIVVDMDKDGYLDEGEPIDSWTTTGFEAIPEFTTIAIPVAAILGLVFLFSRRRKKEK